MIDTHKRWKTTYSNLERNLSCLYTYERFPNVQIPKTTNLLESRFAALKEHLRLNKENKVNLITAAAQNRGRIEMALLGI